VPTGTSAKSFIAVDLACCVATGTQWRSHQVERGKVLYLIAEGTSGLFLRVDEFGNPPRRRADD
jgi:putative DNA primase/helicase